MRHCEVCGIEFDTEMSLYNDNICDGCAIELENEIIGELIDEED